MTRLAQIVFTALAMISAVSLRAENLGTYGEMAWPVAEPDYIELIKGKLRQLEASGRLDELKQQAVERVKQSVNRPPALNIPRARTTRSYIWDPTMVVDRTITAPDGSIMYPAGTKVNPLKVIEYKTDLLFANGDDPDQVAFIRNYLASSNRKVYVILTGGSHMEMMRDFNASGLRMIVYFDQRGMMTSRIGITAVPAVVRQEGLVFRVQEVAL